MMKSKKKLSPIESIVESAGCKIEDITDEVKDCFFRGDKNEGYKRIKRNIRRRLRFSIVSKIDAWVAGEPNEILDQLMEREIERSKEHAQVANATSSNQRSN